MSELSRRLTSRIPSDVQKRDGIFFTPPTHVRFVVDTVLKAVRQPVRTVLEPSCGSCEFVRELDNRLTKARIHGYEINSTICSEIRSLRFKKDNKVKLICGDFLKANIKTKYDLVVGNPPYYETTNPSPSARLMSGRVNVYLLFIDKALTILKKGGVLAFVLPSNFLTNSYAEPFRRYLAAHFEAIDIHVFDDTVQYLNTKQRTCALIVRNGGKDLASWRPFSYVVGGDLLFNSRCAIKHIRALTANASSLWERGFRVSVGNVLWNANRDALTTDSSKTRLIYSDDIAATGTVAKTPVRRNPDKKPYIDRPGSTTPCIVVNRGHGKSGSYDFRYAMVNTHSNSTIPYLLENHVLAIRYMPPVRPVGMNEKRRRNDDIRALQALLRSLNDPRTLAFVKLACANNAINVRELQHMLPVYI